MWLDMSSGIGNSDHSQQTWWRFERILNLILLESRPMALTFMKFLYQIAQLYDIPTRDIDRITAKPGIPNLLLPSLASGYYE